MILNIRPEPIEPENAKKEMEVYKDIRKKGDGRARGAFSASVPEPLRQQGRNYHNSTFNAFYFSRAEVLKFFFGTDIPAIPSAGDPAEGILIIQGCHKEDTTMGGNSFVKGTPTVILSGVKTVHVGGVDKLRTIDPAFSSGNASETKVVEQYPPQKISSTFTQVGTQNIYIIE